MQHLIRFRPTPGSVPKSACGSVPEPTRGSDPVWGHGPSVQLLQCLVQLVQFAGGGLELTFDLGGAPPVGDGAPQPLGRLFDLQLSLDLLFE